jgi:hypothetical protein
MKTMIVVRGSHNTGKTQSIKKVYEIIIKLKDTYKSLEIEVLDYSEHSKGDFKAVFKYKGKKIGIESLGDPGSKHKERLKELAEDNCEIIITASRTNGETHESVLSIMKEYDYNFYWVISQMICVKGDPLFDTWDEYIAKGIIKLIDESI